jgi:clan AA aspartic protease
MGETRVDITLKNISDEYLFKSGHLSDKDIRSVEVRALVDTGAVSIVINEDICQKLGLRIEGMRFATLAGGGKVNCKITEGVRIYWKDRDAICQAVVLPEGETLPGVIPLEFMDLIVDPVAEQLVGAHEMHSIAVQITNAA